MAYRSMNVRRFTATSAHATQIQIRFPPPDCPISACRTSPRRWPQVRQVVALAFTGRSRYCDITHLPAPTAHLLVVQDDAGGPGADTPSRLAVFTSLGIPPEDMPTSAMVFTGSLNDHEAKRRLAIMLLRSLQGRVMVIPTYQGEAMLFPPQRYTTRMADISLPYLVVANSIDACITFHAGRIPLRAGGHRPVRLCGVGHSTPLLFLPVLYREVALAAGHPG